MLARYSLVFAITLIVLLAGCGGKEEVKKNEGPIVNVPPTSSPVSGGPSGAAVPGNVSTPPPPIPKINE